MKANGIVSVILIMVILLSACTPAPSTNSAANKPVELTFWYANGAKIGETNEALVKQFNESQNEIKVTAHFQGNYSDLLAKLQASFVAKNAPDLSVIENVATGKLGEAGILEELTPYVKKSQVDLSDFVPSMMGNSYVGGKLYSFPYMRSTSILYMNADLLKKAGLDPSGPKTWDELREYVEKLSVPGERYGITLPLDIYRFEATIQQAGGKMLSDDEGKAIFNSAEGVAALDFWVDLHRRGMMEFPTGDKMDEAAKQTFFNQRAGMLIFASSSITQLMESAKEKGFELVASILPVRTEDGKSRMRGSNTGANIAMLSTVPAEKKEAAWKFMEWMTARDQVVQISTRLGYQPTRYSSIKSEEIQKIFEAKPIFQVASKQMEYSAPRPMHPSYGQIAGIVREQIEKVILNKANTTQAVLDEAVLRANEVLSKNK